MFLGCLSSSLVESGVLVADLFKENVYHLVVSVIWRGTQHNVRSSSELSEMLFNSCFGDILDDGGLGCPNDVLFSRCLEVCFSPLHDILQIC